MGNPRADLVNIQPVNDYRRISVVDISDDSSVASQPYAIRYCAGSKAKMGIPAPTAGSAALVTGASSGIGLALSKQLAGAGYDIIVVARRGERLRALAVELAREYGVRVDSEPCDLADAADRNRLLDNLVSRQVRIDILILCAGFGMVGPYLEHDCDRLLTMVRTNLESIVALTRALTPAMANRRRGAVLLVSSIAGNQPMPYFAAYAATKAAVTSLGESLHYELAPMGVAVSVLAPANVATELAGVAGATAQGDRQPAFVTATTEQCAKTGLDALRTGRRKVTPLPQATAFAWLGAHLPRSIWFRICRMMLK